MLDSFRSLSSGIFAKIILGFLILTFAVWGIEDMVRQPGRNHTVATVGGNPITVGEFGRALHRDTENMKRMMGDNYSPEILKSFRLPQQTLQKLVNQALIRRESEEMGLVPSDADVVRRIRTNQAFQDSKGNFDKSIFEMMLRNMNMSEKTYVEQMRQEIAANLLLETLLSETPVNDTAVHALLEAREEQRTVTLYTLNTGLITDMPKPTDTQLKEYYDAHNKQFTAPEYRTLSYVTLSQADVHEAASVSDDDLRAAYKERIEEFKHPERRTVEQLLFSSEDKARKALEALRSGKTVSQVGKDLDALNKDATAMGKVEKANIFESAADIVFSLKTNEYSAPLQSPFGWHIFHVTAIDAPSTDTFEQARATLEKDEKQKIGDEGLNKLANKMEDAFAGGSTLQEVAKDLGVKVSTIGPVSKEGNSPEGTKLKDLPNFDKFLDVAFHTDEKSESPLATSKGGLYYTVRVDKITPERLRSLDEVRGLVEAGWQKDEREKRLAALAKDISPKFAKASERAGVIGKYNLKPAASGTIKHSTRALGGLPLPPMMVSEAFGIKPQQATSAQPGKNGDYMIAVVDSVIPTTLSDKDDRLKPVLNEIRRGLTEGMQNEILEQYSRYLASKHPVSVNDEVLKSMEE